MSGPTLPNPFGRYVIERVLGAGGMGTVYLARDTLLNRHVALKVPHITRDDPEITQRFLREAQAAAQVDHPNVCPVFDYGIIEGHSYLIMPFLQGQPLSRQMVPEEPWNLDQALLLVHRLAEVVASIHDKGLIHRDLKPANIMMRPDGAPVLMDFGLARSCSSLSQCLTEKGQFVGTPSYMAPEQVRGLQDQDPRTDVWALGVILYEMVTGYRPFPAPNPLAAAKEILDKEPPSPSSHLAALGALKQSAGASGHPRSAFSSRVRQLGGLSADHLSTLDTLCLTALRKDPAQRYPSMRAFAQAVLNFLKQPGIIASDATTTLASTSTPTLPTSIPPRRVVPASPTPSSPTILASTSYLDDPQALAFVERLRVPMRRDLGRTGHPVVSLDFKGFPLTEQHLQLLTRLPNLELLDFSDTPLSDTGVQHLNKLWKLQDLYFRNTKVSDTGMEALAWLSYLRVLYLDGTAVTDAGLAHLTWCPDLTVLSLADTRVTDAGLQYLTKHAELCRLSVRGTLVTQGGRDGLQQVLPRCKIAGP